MFYDEKSRRIFCQGDDPNYETGWTSDEDNNLESEQMELPWG